VFPRPFHRIPGPLGSKHDGEKLGIHLNAGHAEAHRQRRPTENPEFLLEEGRDGARRILDVAAPWVGDARLETHVHRNADAI